MEEDLTRLCLRLAGVVLLSKDIGVVSVDRTPLILMPGKFSLSCITGVTALTICCLSVFAEWAAERNVRVVIIRLLNFPLLVDMRSWIAGGWVVGHIEVTASPTDSVLNDISSSSVVWNIESDRLESLNSAVMSADVSKGPPVGKLRRSSLSRGLQQHRVYFIFELWYRDYLL